MLDAKHKHRAKTAKGLSEIKPEPGREVVSTSGYFGRSGLQNSSGWHQGSAIGMQSSFSTLR